MRAWHEILSCIISHQIFDSRFFRENVYKKLQHLPNRADTTYE